MNNIQGTTIVYIKDDGKIRMIFKSEFKAPQSCSYLIDGHVRKIPTLKFLSGLYISLYVDDIFNTGYIKEIYNKIEENKKEEGINDLQILIPGIKKIWLLGGKIRETDFIF